MQPNHFSPLKPHRIPLLWLLMRLVLWRQTPGCALSRTAWDMNRDTNPHSEHSAPRHFTEKPHPQWEWRQSKNLACLRGRSQRAQMLHAELAIKDSPDSQWTKKDLFLSFKRTSLRLLALTTLILRSQSGAWNCRCLYESAGYCSTSTVVYRLQPPILHGSRVDRGHARHLTATESLDGALVKCGTELATLKDKTKKGSAVHKKRD